MKHNFYLHKSFEEIIKEHNISKSEAGRVGVMKLDPDASWIVLLHTEYKRGPKRDQMVESMASQPILADIRQLQRLNDHLSKIQFDESYAWFPAKSYQDAADKWQYEAVNGRKVEFGIIGILRDSDLCQVAFVTASEAGEHDR